MKIYEMRKVLDIFAKHRGESSILIAGSEHDVIWFEGARLPEKDHKALDKLGVFWSDEYDCYTKYT